MGEGSPVTPRRHANAARLWLQKLRNLRAEKSDVVTEDKLSRSRKQRDGVRLREPQTLPVSSSGTPVSSPRQPWIGHADFAVHICAQSSHDDMTSECAVGATDHHPRYPKVQSARRSSNNPVPNSSESAHLSSQQSVLLSSCDLSAGRNAAAQFDLAGTELRTCDMQAGNVTVLSPRSCPVPPLGNGELDSPVTAEGRVAADNYPMQSSNEAKQTKGRHRDAVQPDFGRQQPDRAYELETADRLPNRDASAGSPKLSVLVDEAPGSQCSLSFVSVMASMAIGSVLPPSHEPLPLSAKLGDTSPVHASEALRRGSNRESCDGAGITQHGSDVQRYTLEASVSAAGQDADSDDASGSTAATASHIKGPGMSRQASNLKHPQSKGTYSGGLVDDSTFFGRSGSLRLSNQASPQDQVQSDTLCHHATAPAGQASSLLDICDTTRDSSPVPPVDNETMPIETDVQRIARELQHRSDVEALSVQPGSDVSNANQPLADPTDAVTKQQTEYNRMGYADTCMDTSSIGATAAEHLPTDASASANCHLPHSQSLDDSEDVAMVGDEAVHVLQSEALDTAPQNTALSPDADIFGQSTIHGDLGRASVDWIPPSDADQATCVLSGTSQASMPVLCVSEKAVTPSSAPAGVRGACDCCSAQSVLKSVASQTAEDSATKGSDQRVLIATHSIAAATYSADSVHNQHMPKPGGNIDDAMAETSVSMAELPRQQDQGWDGDDTIAGKQSDLGRPAESEGSEQTLGPAVVRSHRGAEPISWHRHSSMAGPDASGLQQYPAYRRLTSLPPTSCSFTSGVHPCAHHQPHEGRGYGFRSHCGPCRYPEVSPSRRQHDRYCCDGQDTYNGSVKMPTVNEREFRTTAPQWTALSHCAPPANQSLQHTPFGGLAARLNINQNSMLLSAPRRVPPHMFASSTACHRRMEVPPTRARTGRYHCSNGILLPDLSLGSRTRLHPHLIPTSVSGVARRSPLGLGTCRQLCSSAEYAAPQLVWAKHCHPSVESHCEFSRPTSGHLFAAPAHSGAWLRHSHTRSQHYGESCHSSTAAASALQSWAAGRHAIFCEKGASFAQHRSPCHPVNECRDVAACQQLQAQTACAQVRRKLDNMRALLHERSCWLSK
eukprot:jgi/Ulvmu1/1258/UM109_0056.1